MIWSPWRGCKRVSEGCRYCYTHKGDKKRNVNTSDIVKTNDFKKLVAKKQDGTYIVPSNQKVNVCFQSDFLIEEADLLREECYQMMYERSDLSFLFLTKRIHRFGVGLPKNWGKGYPNVTVGVSVEDQKTVDERLSYFSSLPILHKNIICQPLLERVDITPYLDGVELVVVGGEEDKNARVLDYDWVLDIKEQCKKHKVSFVFRQCGTHFLKDGKLYHLKRKDLMHQARLAKINHVF